MFKPLYLCANFLGLKDVNEIMMTKKSDKVYIVGAGISGLIAAKVLEQNGYSPIILEATERIGGRVQTIELDGCHLDVGFQVVLESYPMVKKYLDLDKLEMQRFKPGAVIFKKGVPFRFGDPNRDLSFLFPSLFSKIGSLSDWIKLLKLKKKLKKKSIPAIFETTETSTYEYLKTIGFSSQIINQFFKPFFGGVFLEDGLPTSSRMFEFVYKMLAEGAASIPKQGMSAISNQLKEQLKTTKIVLNTPVKYVRDGSIELENGEQIDTDGTIIATNVESLIPNMRNENLEWNSCQTLYFKSKSTVINPTIIGLVTGEKSLINNIAYVSPNVGEEDYLLLVTIIKSHQLNEKELIQKIMEELEKECSITGVEFVRSISIKKALPKISDLRYAIEPSETQLMSSVFGAGDHLLNPSLNAAMLSGERAAKGLVEKLEGNFGL